MENKYTSYGFKPLSLFPELTFDVNNGITYCKGFHLNSNLHIRQKGGQIQLLR